MKKYILLATASLSLVACDNNDNLLDRPVEAKITASIDNTSVSRASEAEWNSGDKIGITMSDRYINMEYETATGNGVFTGNTLYFLNKQNVETVTAYYPFTGTEGTAAGIIEISTTAETQTPSEQTKFDFLYTKKENVTGANPTIALDFSHKMSKMTFTFKKGNDGTDVNKITSYSIEGLILDGTFDTATGVCANKNVASQPLTIDLSATTVTSGTSLTPLIVFPQKPAGNSLTLKIHDSDNQDFICTLNLGANGIVAGNNYQFTITVKKTELSVSSTITDWITEEINGDAISDDSEEEDETDE